MWGGFNPAFECAGGAVRFAKPHPPLRGPYLFPLAGKDMEEKGAGTVFYSAVAPESRVVLFYVLSLHRL